MSDFLEPTLDNLKVQMQVLESLADNEEQLKSEGLMSSDNDQGMIADYTQRFINYLRSRREEDRQAMLAKRAAETAEKKPLKITLEDVEQFQREVDARKRVPEDEPFKYNLDYYTMQDTDTSVDSQVDQLVRQKDVAKTIEDAPSGIMSKPVADEVQYPDGKDPTIIEAALEQNKNNTVLDRGEIERQVLAVVGKNMYAASILGAFSKESGSDFSAKVENMGYTKATADKLFTDAKVSKALKSLSKKEQEKVNSGAASIAFGKALMDIAYQGGHKYRGRGLIQITHRDTYKKVGDMIGLDLVANPDLVNDPRYAVPAALAFLETKGFFSKEPTKYTLHRAVNPGSGSALRDSRWKAAQDYLASFNAGGGLMTSPRPMLRPDDFKVASN